MNTKEQWKIISEEVAKDLVYLYDRWQDECEYEDINDYLQAIKKHVPNAYEVTTEPFGFKAKCDDGILKVWLSEEGDYVEFHAEFIKE